ncbi:glucose-6-phosphate dehydrogenase [Sphingomonas prati]|uniref:Glucose-6-phosphate 1-dehydrogenase n=1 Tax=Sphingomonas prati TaxID=1843237 RepID=A0A7W9BUC4_9SPHN|nr:glucose-6-phosphate dehydrogenase [Sphingomonas prati]MBB5729818.1 glucose-6-phosphate 1-dehydrogenase [Sphingomonas prati]GGE89281.1 glucose-6-phosphate 1-dehydrogenase [Sphingomonas prati]
MSAAPSSPAGGTTATPPAPPATLVIFGALGDLTRRLLVPAIVNLVRSGLVGDDFKIIGVSHHDSSDDALREQLDDFIGKADGEGGAHGDKSGAGDPDWLKLRDRITYLKGDFEDAATYEALKDRIDGNAAFYLATAPGFFGPVIDSLGDAGLLTQSDEAFRRVVIEKPFGHDLPSAEALDERILKHLDETQVYRIDHFLGKETVQNILVTRFANTMVEAVWNNRYIDHVQITAAETVTVGTRGKFYDTTGAMRDMVPNHLFQLLAMVGMEPPNDFGSEAIRNEKAKVIAAIRAPRPEDVADVAVRGRYTAGRAGDADVADYRSEPEVAPDSKTETYVALKLMVDSWRWAGVPFYLRTGKGLAARDTEIVVQFKPVPYAQFAGVDHNRLPPNRMVIQIQPDEGLSIEILAKKPGPVIEPAPVSLDFAYSDHFKLGHTTGYETLLYDMLTGDQTLFQRADQIESGWEAVQPILDAWAADGEPEPYPAGSDGPAAAADLLTRDGRAWHKIGRPA